MSVSITLNVRLGPLVSLRVNGASCRELAEALDGYQDLNDRVEALCSGLAERVYPEGFEGDTNDDAEEGEREEER
jgi:hypothetical protein